MTWADFTDSVLEISSQYDRQYVSARAEFRKHRDSKVVVDFRIYDSLLDQGYQAPTPQGAIDLWAAALGIREYDNERLGELEV